ELARVSSPLYHERLARADIREEIDGFGQALSPVRAPQMTWFGNWCPGPAAGWLGHSAFPLTYQEPRQACVWVSRRKGAGLLHVQVGGSEQPSILSSPCSIMNHDGLGVGALLIWAPILSTLEGKNTLRR
ncbi:hypothetical protein THAOC_15707, partial [Thalassiosira oceanica]